MTSADRAHFDTFGFVVWRQLLSSDEAEEIHAELLQVMTDAYAGSPFDGTTRHWLPLLNDRSPKIAALAEDPRFYEKAKELVDGDVVLMIADGNRYVSHTGWHPDGGPDSHGVKFFLYLDTLGAETGALRVIPGSHRQPFYGAVHDFVRDHGTQVDGVPGFVFECQPGDVLAFDYPMWHGSKGGTDDRRMCTIEYYKAPDDDGREIKDHFATVVKVTADVFPDPGGFPFYDREWLANRSQNTIRAEIIDGMQQAGLFEIAGVEVPIS